MATKTTRQFEYVMILLHKFEKNDHIPALAIFLYIATSCGEQLEWLNFYITTKVALLFFFGFSQHSSPYLFAMKQLTIQGPKRTVPDHVETWQFHSLLGLKKVVSQAMTFNSTVHRVISLFLTESTHNIMWPVYHLMMGFWLLATWWTTQATNS